jgi:hypothetical protein
MPQPKYTLHKHVKIGGKWRYCRAAEYSNHRVKPDIVLVGHDRHEEKHEEGGYFIRHKNQWIDAGTDALEAQRMRSKLVDQADYSAPTPTIAKESTPETLDEIIEKYLRETEANLSKGTLKAYRNSRRPCSSMSLRVLVTR